MTKVNSPLTIILQLLKPARWPCRGWVQVSFGVLLLLSTQACRRSVSIVSPQPPSLANDRRFILEFLAHGELDLEILDNCRQSSAREELKSACQDSLVQQQMERTSLQARLKEWFGVSDEQPVKLSQIKEEKRQFLRSLESQRDLPFESQLLHNIVSHDSEALQQMSTCAKEAFHPELRQFCQGAADLRRAEGRKMETRICQWYRDCISQAFPPYK